MSDKLTPEKYLEGGVTTDPYGMFVWANRPKGLQMVVDIQMRGWGDIQQHFETQEEAGRFQDDLCKFIVDAINEKLGLKPGLVLLAKALYKAKDGTIKPGIEIDGKYYALESDIKAPKYSEYDKWSWMTSYCKRQGLSPGQKEAWEKATKAYEDHFKKATALGIDNEISSLSDNKEDKDSH